MADDMDVIVLGRAETRGAVTEVCVPDQSDLLQDFEIAVDRSDVHSRNRLTDLLRRRMSKPAYRGQHLVSLRGDPQASGPQPRCEFCVG
jgi:hypothetical protein